ncbi:MAG: hypothetical protein GY928_33320 [Colwellia sp.]|nr:hypothetical protein [Colwellia sp.]
MDNSNTRDEKTMNKDTRDAVIGISAIIGIIIFYIGLSIFMLMTSPHLPATIFSVIATPIVIVGLIYGAAKHK